MMVARSVVVLAILASLLAPSYAPKKAAKRKEEKPPPRGKPVPKQHPEQPQMEQIREEDIPPGTKVRKIKDGEVLDLTENAQKEQDKKWGPDVVRMFDAVMTDDPSQVNDVLKSGVDINIRGPQGYTPLFQAVLSHQLNVAHFLLEHGADATRRNNGGFNPLDAAAFGGCASCVRMLLKHGVDPTLVGRDGFNALHRAIWGDEESHTEIVEMLLEAGLSPTKMAEKPGEGMVEPINMINENEKTEKLLKRWIAKKEKGGNVGGLETQQEKAQAKAFAKAQEEAMKNADKAFAKGDASASAGEEDDGSSKVHFKATEVPVSSKKEKRSKRKAKEEL